MSVTFTPTVGSAVEIQNPDLGDVLKLRKRQAIAESADGSFYRYALAAGVAYERELTWSNLRRTERDLLATFFHTTVSGVLTNFTFTDERGSEWSAHFLDTELEFTTVSDATSGAAATFTIGSATHPTTTRSGGYYSVSVRILLWGESPASTGSSTATSTGTGTGT